MADPFRAREYRNETEPDAPVAETEPVEADEDAVPAGTTKEVLAWVGDDLEKAKRALEVEVAKGENGLKGLKRELSKLLEN